MLSDGGKFQLWIGGIGQEHGEVGVRCAQRVAWRGGGGVAVAGVVDGFLERSQAQFAHKVDGVPKA